MRIKRNLNASKISFFVYDLSGLCRWCSQRKNWFSVVLSMCSFDPHMNVFAGWWMNEAERREGKSWINKFKFVLKILVRVCWRLIINLFSPARIIATQLKFSFFFSFFGKTCFVSPRLCVNLSGSRFILASRSWPCSNFKTLFYFFCSTHEFFGEQRWHSDWWKWLQISREWCRPMRPRLASLDSDRWVTEWQPILSARWACVSKLSKRCGGNEIKRARDVPSKFFLIQFSK